MSKESDDFMRDVAQGTFREGVEVAKGRLPELPWPDKTVYGPNRTVEGHFFSANKMREYGKACFNAAIALTPPTDGAEALLREAREYVAVHHIHHTIISSLPVVVEPCLRCELQKRIDAHLSGKDKG